MVETRPNEREGRVKLGIVLSLILAVGIPAHTFAQPVISLEGYWEGQCTRGSKSINANLLMDQLAGQLNGKNISGLTKGKFSIQFSEGKKTFTGTFSNDTANLTGTLTVDGKGAPCSLTRRINKSDRLCVRNLDATEIYFRLDPGPASTVRLMPRQEVTVSTGDRTGKLCWNPKDFTGCPRSLPQVTYGC